MNQKWQLCTFLACSLLSLGFVDRVPAANRLTLKNGLIVEGDYSSIDEISKNLIVRNPSAGGVKVRNIVVVDDELRRTFFPHRNLAFPPTEAATDDTPIKIRQRLGNPSSHVGAIGSILAVTPFDEIGRRKITVMTKKGRQDYVQQITEISPIYTRLQSKSVKWDMRISTNSIPSDQLRLVMLRNDRSKGAEARRDMVRLLFQSERFQEAAKELEMAMKEFPELGNKQLSRLNEQLVQRGAQRLLQEITRRRKAGQHNYVTFLLNGFESTGVATENIIQASEMLQEYEAAKRDAEKVLSLLEPLVEEVEIDAPKRKQIQQLHAEIKRDLNVNNLIRFRGDFLRLAQGEGLEPEDKLAIAMSGWLLGEGEVERNLQVASSLLEVRNLVRQYLRAMGSGKRAIRKELLSQIADLEGGSPKYVAKLLAKMTPPLDMPTNPELPSPELPGNFVIDVPGMPEGFPVRYQVQLPPEYDHYKRYPTIVTLHALGAGPEAQINWWAGDYDALSKMRRGQATRQGYIVIAPEWTLAAQSRYEYSAREHHIVLTALRDAMRRFSIDSDRTFISGHAAGGDAAWDIAVSHPDHWAGMALVGARADYGASSPQYVTFYDQNAKYFPMYFVFGELDGGKKADNAMMLNRYMRPGYDCVVTEYQGRGNEHFYEEIQRIFEWMELHQRERFPSNTRTPDALGYQVDAMRPWDKYFWFTEFEGFPKKTMVSPFEWPANKPASSEIEAKVATNHVSIKSGGAARTTIFLSPDMVNFDERIQISVNGKRDRQEAVPSLEVMLEDARGRADRQHVYWAKVEVQTGR